MTCPGCGAEFDEFDHEMRYNKTLDIAVCEQCDERIDNHHGIDGKYVVIKCKECGQIERLEWKPYKKRGRPTGSKSEKSIKEAKAQESLEKWTGTKKISEEYTNG